MPTDDVERIFDPDDVMYFQSRLNYAIECYRENPSFKALQACVKPAKQLDMAIKRNEQHRAKNGIHDI